MSCEYKTGIKPEYLYSQYIDLHGRGKIKEKHFKSASLASCGPFPGSFAVLVRKSPTGQPKAAQGPQGGLEDIHAKKNTLKGCFFEAAFPQGTP